jgi:ubiquinone/menaquinone biosynthesis C-methylase UbiE
MSELLCEAIALHPGQRVLDVADGNGNAALAAARRFGEVTCTDYAQASFDRARQSAAAEGLPVAIQETDAENLPYSDASFDVVVPAIVAMFAPNQVQVARELMRLCRRGGKIGMTNWTSDGFVGRSFRTTEHYVSPTPGLKPVFRRRTEASLRELFGDSVRELTITPLQHIWRFRSPERFVETVRAYYGPTQKAFDALDASGQEQLKQRSARSGSTVESC